MEAAEGGSDSTAGVVAGARRQDRFGAAVQAPDEDLPHAGVPKATADGA